MLLLINVLLATCLLVISDLSYVKEIILFCIISLPVIRPIKYKTHLLPFKINFYRITKIIPYYDFSKELKKNNYFMEFKEIMGRQYEKECLVGEFSI